MPARSAVRTNIAVACAMLMAWPACAQRVDARSVVLRFGDSLDVASAAAVERGTAIVRVQPTADGRDVAILGIVRIATTRERYMAGVQRFTDWLRTPSRTRLGLFGEPATVSDLASLTLSRGDARDLESCRAGDCTTKLSADEMQRMRSAVDWSAPDYQQRLLALTRQRYVDYIEAYRREGNAALPLYEDKAPVRAVDAFEAVLNGSSMLTQTLPALATYLRETPRVRPVGVVDVMHWSEDAGPRVKPILSLTHAVIWSPPGLAATSVIVRKQLYANHYFEAALEVACVTARLARDDPAAVYLAIERRFRFDNLPRGGLLNIRGRAVSGLRDRLLADLRREQATRSATGDMRGIPASGASDARAPVRLPTGHPPGEIGSGNFHNP